MGGNLSIDVICQAYHQLETFLLIESVSGKVLVCLFEATMKEIFNQVEEEETM